MHSTSVAISLSALSFMLAVIWGQPLLRVLKHFKVGKLIRVEGPQSHQVKMGIPTMGGVMIILPVLLLTVLLNAAALLGFNLISRAALLPVAVMVVFGILGAVDDWEGIRGPRRGLGMRARTKFVIQMMLSIGVACLLYFYIQPTHLFWSPTRSSLDLGLWYIPTTLRMDWMGWRV
jgi:phospho-N-acetylmuramoyl-pentapeptide-transferase